MTPWTVAYQAPPSVGFPRQEYWSGLPLPSPMNGWDSFIQHSRTSKEEQSQWQHFYAIMSMEKVGS